jgi:hypothetical protein
VFTSRCAMHCCWPFSALEMGHLALPELSGSAEVPSIRDLIVATVRPTRARCALQSVRFGCSIRRALPPQTVLSELAARPEFLTH